MQALSVWIICAFSIHRSRTIIKPSMFLSASTNQNSSTQQPHQLTFNARLVAFLKSVFDKITFRSTKTTTTPNFDLEVNTNYDDDDDFNTTMSNKKRINNNNKNQDSSSSCGRNYFFHINMKNNFNFQAYELKFYTQPVTLSSYLSRLFEKKTALTSKFCFYCFCTCKPKYKTHENYIKASSTTSASHSSSGSSGGGGGGQPNRLNSSRCTILILYLMAIAYLIPQMFEKKLTNMRIYGKYYVFPTITQFGESRFFRQIFHLWFYLLFIYIIPFLLIFVFNLLLLRAFLSSKKRCQRYKLKLDPSIILKACALKL